MSRRQVGTLLAVAWTVSILVLSARGARPLWLVGGWLSSTGPPLLAALAVCGAAWGFGRPLRRLLLPEFGSDDPLSRGLVEWALGLGVLQTAAALLGSTGLLSGPAARLLVVLGLLAAAAPWFSEPQWSSSKGARLRSIGPLHVGALVLGTALIFPALLTIGAPPMGSDEAQYHRRFVEQLLRTGRFPADPSDAQTGFAMGLHALGFFPASLVGVPGIRPFCLLLGLGAVASGERVSRRLFGSAASPIYLLVVLGSSLVLRVLPTFNTDLVLGLFVGVAVLIVLDWARVPSSPGGRPWALAIVGGTALSIKYTTPVFIAPIYCIVAALLLWQPPGRERARAFAALLAAALLPALFALPWMLKNLAATGEPLFPIVGMPAPSPSASSAFVYNFTENYGAGGGWRALLRSPWDLFVLGRDYDRRLFLGRLNPWPLAALPGLILVARRNRQGLFLLLAVLASFAIWSGPLRRAIYLLPAWPLLAALTAGGLAELVRSAPSRTKVPLAAGLGVLLTVSSAAEVATTWSAGLESAPAACGEVSWSEFELSKVPDAHVLHWVAEHSAPDEGVAALWTWFVWGLPNPVRWIGAEDFTPLRLAIHRAGSVEALHEELRSSGVRWLIRRPHRFNRRSYPMVGDEAFRLGFEEPLAIADELVDRYATERFRYGTLSVYELTEAPSTRGSSEVD